MRTFTTLLIAAFLFQSCVVSYHTYDLDESNRITTAPFSKTDQPLDVFFTGTSAPERAYVNIKLLRQSMSYRQGNMDFLLTNLLNRSRQLGADAFIVMGKDNVTQFSSVGGSGTSETSTSMWGMAIRYADNLVMNEAALSYLEVIPQGSKAGEPGGIIHIRDNGELVVQDNNYWTRFVYNYSLENLLDSRFPWRYTINTSAPHSADYPSTRTLIRNGVNITKVNMTGFLNGKVASFRISLLNQKIVNQIVRLRYDDEMKLLDRTWNVDTQTEYKAIRHYDADGRIAYETYVRTARKGQPDALLRVNYHYHTPETFQALLEDVQVVKPLKEAGNK